MAAQEEGPEKFRVKVVIVGECNMYMKFVGYMIKSGITRMCGKRNAVFKSGISGAVAMNYFG